MILPDHKIEIAVRNGSIGITPYDRHQIQPASYDLRLDRYFRFYVRPKNKNGKPPIIDVKSPLRMTDQIEVENYFEIGPHDFVLASSIERFKFPFNIAGRCEGKSSLGRMGLTIHVTAGFFDPGFEGTATLELSNVNSMPIRIYPGMKIAQMSFHEMSAPCAVPYGWGELGSKYIRQGDDEPGPKESEYFRNFKIDTICDVCGQVGSHDLTCAEGRDEEEERKARNFRIEREGNWTPPDGPSSRAGTPPSHYLER